MRQAISLQALPLSEQLHQAGQWVHLLNPGVNQARDGRTFVVSDPKRIVHVSLAHRTEIAVDYEHQTELAEKNGQPAPAAGWLKRLDVRDTGIWAFVEWTEKARQMVAAREYRFVSPTINIDAKRNILKIVGAGLTNRPALVLTALAKEGNHMTDLQRIAVAFGLSEGASVDEILAAIKALALDELKEQQVPTEHVRQLLETFTQERAKDQEFRAVLSVDRAVSSGKIAPVLREWALEYCLKDRSGFEAMVEKMPVLLSPGEEHALARASLRSHSGSGGQADDAIARQLGIEPNAMR